MRIWSYVGKTVEQGGWTGVCRFDSLLRLVFPEMQSVTRLPAALGREDVVIVDNHLSLGVPPGIRTVVVHHGCAATHYDRDPGWRTPQTRQIVEDQRAMFASPGRVWVAPSAWVLGEFSKHGAHQVMKGNAISGALDMPIAVIPHWVEPIALQPEAERLTVIGDWRDSNKGAGVWRKIAELCPQWEFRPLDFRDDAGRRRQYGEASLFLSLSLSEGFNYAMADAEAAELPIVTTDTGAFMEFKDAEVIPWQLRDDPGVMAAAIERKLSAGRRLPSFYHNFTFSAWKAAWERAVQ